MVLDEPSAGLHPHDVGRLLRVLRRLRDQGQTVLVVEHDPAIVRGSGLAGGPRARARSPGRAPAVERPAAAGGGQPHARAGCAGRSGGHSVRRGPGPDAAAGRPDRNNLRGVAVALKLEALNVITGISGAGKTSLLDAIVARLGEAGGAPFRRLVSVDASPIGRTPRSNPATYTGAFDLIRDLFAATPEARALGLGKGHFSFNTAGGRCEACEGAGVIEVGMRHLGRLELTCGACAGRRFHPEVLSVRYRGRSVADLLEGSVAAGRGLLPRPPGLGRILAALMDCGLGHLPLGQPATTLSGGEAQRVKLAAELARAGQAPPSSPWTSPPPGCTRRTWRCCWAPGTACWPPATPCWWWTTTRKWCGPRTRSSTWARAAGPGAGGWWWRDPPRPWPHARIPSPGTTGRSGGRAAPAAAPGGRSTHGAARGHHPQPAAPGPGHSRPRASPWSPGPSGCGKSSLVFDTLLAEAQNRFADLVAPWARRLLPRRGGAELDTALGLRAAVAVPQQAGRRNPRSRVGTVTELDQLLRLLFARAGTRPSRRAPPRWPGGAAPAARPRRPCGPRPLPQRPGRRLPPVQRAGVHPGL